MQDLTIESLAPQIDTEIENQPQELEEAYRKNLYGLVDGNIPATKESLHKYITAAKRWALDALELINSDKGKEEYHKLTNGSLYDQELDLNGDPHHAYPASLLEHTLALDKIINPTHSPNGQIIIEKTVTDALSPFQKLRDIVTEDKLDTEGNRNLPYPAHLTHSAAVGRYNRPSPYWQKRLEGTNNVIKFITDLAPKFPQPQISPVPPTQGKG
ncbi:hypothetical protein A2773_05355 [Candidatus Gottesmanbacteria bacterium RIFCSPHIGHO2_01_FULL_39_10]|uniref:Uncharacterized protein n=1 Tax=Candidatus Gottesmanbacteria bacterium RIFCSPHIGHO2_01_FULL_39_10 TaxID=1798375 RepID=A0A1F5ZNY2_9BACT|nr:MAG: hypothetical protein A2773_05355 [Candidatus Gottesmanbacteria bacterium RIFCSPHIGHO2_01_FULL_39_10]